MYEENEKKISWSRIIKRLITIILIIVAILIIIAVVKGCSNNNKKKPVEQEPVSLKTSLDQMQEATLKYLNKDNLPLEINNSKTVKLKYLINKNLIDNLKDSNGNVCDSANSYSEVTRLENNYAVRLVLKCGKVSDYKVFYIGCFDSCQDGELCIGSESEKNGICTINNNTNTTPIENNEKKTETNTKSNTNNNTSTKNSTNQSTNNKNNSTSANNNSNNTVIKPKEVVLYEYKKCRTVYTCKEGTLNNNNLCSYNKETIYLDKAIKNEIINYVEKEVGSPQEKKTVTIVYYKNPSDAIPTETISYKSIYPYYDINKGYVYEKTEISYVCAKGTKKGSKCVESVPVTTVVYTCQDSTYTYNSGLGKCVKKEVHNYVLEPIKETSCDYTWSEATSLDGWIRTGRTQTKRVS